LPARGQSHSREGGGVIQQSPKYANSDQRCGNGGGAGGTKGVGFSFSSVPSASTLHSRPNKGGCAETYEPNVRAPVAPYTELAWNGAVGERSNDNEEWGDVAGTFDVWRTRAEKAGSFRMRGEDMPLGKVLFFLTDMSVCGCTCHRRQCERRPPARDARFIFRTRPLLPRSLSSQGSAGGTSGASGEKRMHRSRAIRRAVGFVCLRHTSKMSLEQCYRRVLFA